MSTSRNITGALALVVGIATAGAVALWMMRDPPPPPPAQKYPDFPIPVTVTPAQIGDVSERIVLVGDVLAPERAQLAFERSGRISELPIRLGDVVEAGAVLARLDDAVMEEEVAARKASLAQSREMAALAVREADRLKKIQDVGATASEIDRAEAAARNEAAKVTQMEADLALEQARLKQGVLVAPFAAVVTARPVALGSYVDPGDSCCELLSLERREILLELPPQIATSVRPGAAVTIHSDELRDFELEVPLQSVLPSEDVRARTFVGVVRLEPKDDPERKLRPGMFVRASVEIRSAKGAITVPVDCVLEKPEGTQLAIVRPGETPTAAIVPIRVLARDDARAAIEPVGDDPLAADVLVILVGKENVAPGKPLMIVPPPTSATSDAPPAPPASSADSGPEGGP